jgi:hypothetical protein
MKEMLFVDVGFISFSTWTDRGMESDVKEGKEIFLIGRSH